MVTINSITLARAGQRNGRFWWIPLISSPIQKGGQLSSSAKVDALFVDESHDDNSWNLQSERHLNKMCLYFSVEMLPAPNKEEDVRLFIAVWCSLTKLLLIQFIVWSTTWSGVSLPMLCNMEYSSVVEPGNTVLVGIWRGIDCCFAWEEDDSFPLPLPSPARSTAPTAIDIIWNMESKRLNQANASILFASLNSSSIDSVGMFDTSSNDPPSL